MRKNNLSKLILGFCLFGFMACSTTETVQNTSSQNTTSAPTNPYIVKANAPYTPNGLQGQKIIRVALLAPFNASSAAVKEEAVTLKAAIELALKDFGDGKTVLFTEDSGATPQESVQAVKSALNKGADYILGPLFASGVNAIAPYARANKANVISFSTDISEAGKGVYVLTFLPEDEASRIISYAGSRNIKSLVLLLPNGRFGERLEQSARTAASRSGINIIGIERYDGTSGPSLTAASVRAANVSKTGIRNQTAIFMPERGGNLKLMARTLTNNGASTSRVRYLGTGLWNDANTIADSLMFGAWFVSPDTAGRSAFETKFQAATGKRATRYAGMGYDAMSLIAKIGQDGDKSDINRSTLENPNGFNGVDGRFRFQSGVIERSMAIVEISGTGIKTIDAAPTKF